ncbi:PTS sugar transporter subunit IIA [Schleiferilactobacillus harbinensis]|uniref:PTS sugar transporter subunit IIA n=1 Tax=Schleiferilactobacillus harbinensis TaxID=304207 RepID=UPI00345E20B0
MTEKKILVASHGHLASGLQSSIQILTGMGDQLQVIDAYIDNSDYTQQINQFVTAVGEQPAIIFTDLQGGSVNQKVVLAVAGHPNIMVVTQMNLAIILAVLLDNEPLTPAHLDDLVNQSQVLRLVVAPPEDDAKGNENSFFG